MRNALLAILLVATGCYRFAFEQNVSQAPGVTHRVRVPTYFNGFVGTGRVDTTKYCAAPVRTRLKVTATDVLLSVATLLIYTPHTLYITCPARDVTTTASGGSAGAIRQGHR